MTESQSAGARQKQATTYDSFRESIIIIIIIINCRFLFEFAAEVGDLPAFENFYEK